MNKTGVILINIGTPNSPNKKDVKKYLKEFLNDKRIIELPGLFRYLLVNFIIIPFRVKKSSRLYKKLWTKNGSPLLYYSLNLEQKLQNSIGNNFLVYFAMRYGKPSLNLILDEIKSKNLNQLIFLPLFPQYASSTAGSAIELIFEKIKKWETIPNIKIINSFYNNKLFIKNISDQLNNYNPVEFDHILFSYHGLPLKQVYASHNNESCNNFNCITEINHSNKYCYQANCYKTTQLIANYLKINKNKYTICFQSRFAKKWLSPFTDEIIKQKAKEGIKKMLVICPSFVTYCLETNVEIGIEYNQLFKQYGGEQLVLVESLNDQDEWINTVKEIILKT